MNVEAEVTGFLDCEIEEQVRPDRPKNPPGRMVTLERTGGPSGDVTARATVALQCWAESRSEAAALAYRVSKAMLKLKYHPSVYMVTQKSLYHFPGEGGEPRYQIIYEITTGGCLTRPPSN